MSIYLQPNWPADTKIKAYTTLKRLDVINSIPRRDHLKQALQLPNEPIWINQKHTNITLPAKPENRDKIADATYTHEKNQICVVYTADCIPILLCDKKATHVAAIHAGWRGLAKKIITETLQALDLKREEILVWLGPAISQPYFEVGDEIRNLFLELDYDTRHAFKPASVNKWLCDLYAIASLELNKQGVTHIFGKEYCTYSEPNKFFSYRRDKSYKGSMASLIWISDSA